MTNAQMIHITMELWGAIFCLICAIYVLAGRSVDRGRCRWLSAFMMAEVIQLVSDALAWLYRGDPSNLGWYMVRISNLAVFLSNDFLLVIAMKYLEQLLRAGGTKIGKAWKVAIYGICGLSVSMILISQFNGMVYTFDEQNFYHRSSGFVVLSALGMVMTLLILILTRVNKKNLKRLDYLPYIICQSLPLLATVIQAFYYGISLVNISLICGLGLLFCAYEIDRSRQLVESKNELMLSQIKPHFLYNTLGSIEYLCDEDPQAAKTALHHFAKYLRLNMKSLNGSELVDFSQELEYTNEYLWIEKMRFEDKLNISMDIEVTNFKIPPLTLQPIAENAVRHGIRQKEEGGTLRICTKAEGTQVRIIVEDDGVGFEIGKKKDDGQIHLGMRNVEERLRRLCGGSLKVDSTPGKGTVMELIIPR